VAWNHPEVAARAGLVVCLAAACGAGWGSASPPA